MNRQGSSSTRRLESRAREPLAIRPSAIAATLAVAFLLAAGALLLAPWPCFGAEPSVVVEATPNPVGLEDTLTITVTVSGADLGRVSDPVLPPIAGAKLLSGPSQSKQTSLSIVNGRFSQTTSIDFSWEMLPRDEGTLAIPPIEVRIGGKSYRTDPLTVRVVKGEAGSQRRQSRQRGFGPPGGFFDDDPFFGGRRQRDEISARDVIVEASVDRSRAYVGQAIVLTTRLLVGGSVAQVSGVKPLEGGDLKEFWVEEVRVDPEQTKEVVQRDGRTYRAFTVYKRILFPTSAGRFTYGPVAFEVTVGGGGFGLLGDMRQMHPRTEPLAIEVEPLPETGKPDDFSGAVGQFRLQGKADKAEAAQGEAISYEVTIEGKGNLRTATEPKLPEDDGFKVFSAKSRDDSQAGPGGVEAKKVLSYVLIPERPGDLETPRLRFVYFDPDEGRYVVGSPPPARVSVKPGAVPAALAATVTGGPAAAEAKVTKKGEDIRYIKTLPGDPTDESRLPYQSPLFVLLVAVPPLANVALFVAGWRARRRRSDVAGWKARRAARVARTRLARARKRLGGGDHREGRERFHAELSAALVQYLGDRHGVPAIAAAPGRLARALEGKGVSEESVRVFEQVLSDCDAARFSAGSSAREVAEGLYERALEAIEALEGAA